MIFKDSYTDWRCSCPIFTRCVEERVDIFAKNWLTSRLTPCRTLDTAAAALPLRKPAAGEAAAAKVVREVAKVAVNMAAAEVKTDFPSTGCLSSLKKAASYNRYQTFYCAMCMLTTSPLYRYCCIVSEQFIRGWLDCTGQHLPAPRLTGSCVVMPDQYLCVQCTLTLRRHGTT